MMELTPLDVRKKKGDFRRGLRGYEQAQVDDFLDLAADRLEAVVREAASLKERVARLEQQVADYRDREKALTEALVTAQQMREDMRAQSNKEVELVLRQAEQDASRIRADAEKASEREEARLEEMRSRQIQFLASYRKYLEQELSELGAMTRALEMAVGGPRKPGGEPAAPAVPPTGPPRSQAEAANPPAAGSTPASASPETPKPVTPAARGARPEGGGSAPASPPRSRPRAPTGPGPAAKPQARPQSAGPGTQAAPAGGLDRRPGPAEPVRRHATSAVANSAAAASDEDLEVELDNVLARWEPEFEDAARARTRESSDADAEILLSDDDVIGGGDGIAGSADPVEVDAEPEFLGVEPDSAHGRVTPEAAADPVLDRELEAALGQADSVTEELIDLGTVFGEDSESVLEPGLEDNAPVGPVPDLDLSMQDQEQPGESTLTDRKAHESGPIPEGGTKRPIDPAVAFGEEPDFEVSEEEGTEPGRPRSRDAGDRGEADPGAEFMEASGPVGEPAAGAEVGDGDDAGDLIDLDSYDSLKEIKTPAGRADARSLTLHPLFFEPDSGEAAGRSEPGDG